jgi:hypothetical protein
MNNRFVYAKFKNYLLDIPVKKETKNVKMDENILFV